MIDFKPPKIKNKDLDYEFKEILVLNELNKRPTFVSDPLRTFTGHSHERLANRNYINFLEVIDSLMERNLLRESHLNEIINNLTSGECKVILKNINQKSYGKKEELIKRVLINASDKDVKSAVDKNYFVLTDLGLNVLEKYKNVVWICENEEFIFSRSYKLPLKEKEGWKKFNEYYFMDNLDIDPAKTMIDYYKTRESRLVARIYQIEDNEEKFFYYVIKQLGEDINSFLEAAKEGNRYLINPGIDAFHILILEYENFNFHVAERNLENILNEIYIDTIKDKKLLNFDKFERLIILIFNKKTILYNQLFEDLYNGIEKIYGPYNQSKHINNDYNNEDFNNSFIPEEESIINILEKVTKSDERKEEMIFELIDDIDLDMVKKINKKLDDILSRDS